MNFDSLAFFNSQELARLDCLNRETRNSSDLSFAWRLWDSRHSCMAFSPYLYLSHRHEIMRCRSLLRDAVAVAGSTRGTRVTLSSIDETRRLHAALQMAHSVAEEHRAAGGRVARVLVGKFQVTPSSSGTCAFALGIQGPGGCKGELRISLELEDETILCVSALHSRTATLQRFVGDSFEPATSLLDVYSASVDINFGCRNMSLKVDSKPRKAFDSWMETSDASGKKLADEVLCVLCIRESPAANL